MTHQSIEPQTKKHVKRHKILSIQKNLSNMYEEN